MQTQSPFTIYNASAGSGKTFTLVKAYLTILLASNTPYLFKNILAITFTNKAVAEMKDRIIETLKRFDDKAILESPDDMFLAIANTLKIPHKKLHQKAGKLLNTMIHNYAAFDISTIDGFTHKLIRTFAHDLKLPLNFEVELDKEVLLHQAVDRLIAQAGTNKKLTKVLVDFAIEKADDDKSWDVSYDFNKIAKLLVNENDRFFIEQLKHKNLEDFETLKAQLKQDILSTKSDVIKRAQHILNVIDSSGLEFNDFSGSYLPKHFQKLAQGDFNAKFESKWQENIETKPLYPKRVSDEIATLINHIQPEIAKVFHTTKRAFFRYKFFKNSYKNTTPLSVIHAIDKELQSLKEEQNKMLISEFNAIISHEINNQPTPFIYERIGEKFNHYFIDEFQDTSVMQWENLIPLLSNSLATEQGSAMLVGDAKQAIYRWRGGKAEQFMDLFNKKSQPFPFSEQFVEQLPANYRSFQEVVDFNNGFFEFLSHQVFSHDDHQQLYKNAAQNRTKHSKGYVELTFLDFDKEAPTQTLYSDQVLKIINKCLQRGYAMTDICVIVRKKKEGVAIANHLSQQHIPIISSETLLIANAPEVIFVNHILTLLIQPQNLEIKTAVLNFLASWFNISDKHDFFKAHLNKSIATLFKHFEDYNVFIDFETILQQPLYDTVETIVRSFNLVHTSNAYIQFYLDEVLRFSQKKGADISGFLEFFDKKKETLSMVSPKGQDAVQIMTIHKSKGLEFPVVIFPFADLDIYRELEPKVWFPFDKQDYAGFSHTLLNYNKDFENYGQAGLEQYNQHQSELELDSINLLYVALTRAAEQLFIVSKKELSAKGEANPKKYSGLFINYLKHIGQWNDLKLRYHFGDQKPSDTREQPLQKTRYQQRFISTSKASLNIKVVTKSGLLWDSKQQEAIEKGNLIHDMLSHIKTADDIDIVIQNFILSSTISPTQAIRLQSLIRRIVDHELLKPYFSTDYTIYNERDIISQDGMILRPDRLAINNFETIIIDYKTGAEVNKHAQQLQLYEDVLATMGLSIQRKILVYIGDGIKVKII